MAAPEAAQDRPAEHTEGPERRAYPRHAVDCAVVVSPVSGSVQIQGRLSDLSLGGCRVAAEHRYTAGILVRVEVQFQLRGIAFRIVGVTIGSRETKSFAVRFLEMSLRRRRELSEVLDEVAALNAAKEAHSATASEPKSTPAFPPDAISAVSGAPEEKPAKKPHGSGAASGLKPQTERRAQSRHAVNTQARLLLVKAGISMSGRILNLSLGGCRIRTEKQFNVGIYVRVEAEFYLHGLPFRVGGVSQAIQDKNTIGVRFLDMSDRRRKQLTELIAEIEEAALEKSSGAGIASSNESSAAV